MGRSGTPRERQVRHLLEQDGWLVVRAAGSLGVCDLVALRAGDPPRLIEVKTDHGRPYQHFRPGRRHLLIAAAQRAGGEAWLVWWPNRRTPQWIPAATWPTTKV